MTERQLLVPIFTPDEPNWATWNRFDIMRGAVTGLIVEIEDSEPDHVKVPLDGLSVTEERAGDANLQTDMTAQDLAAMPDAAI